MSYTKTLRLKIKKFFYAFSLPESAAINGLWLGTAAEPELFPFVVSPRGAAQKVYNAEVERAKFQRPTDPALLEQVGPRQYRLRIFPIPAARVDNEPNRTGKRLPGELHLRLTYQVMQADGQWPLPQLIEKRNIFWTDDTLHQRDRGRVELSADDWFETAIPAKKAKAQPHSITLADGYHVSAAPLSAHQHKRPTGQQRFAIVVDTSYSMGEHQQALKQAVEQIQAAQNQAAQTQAAQNSLDYYVPSVGRAVAALSEDAVHGDAAKAAAVQSDLSVNDLLFYGSLQPAEMLQQFAAAKGDRTYDAILLLTDEGSYALAQDKGELPALDAPLWLVHIDGKVPAAYEDGLLQQLQASRGGVETGVTAALQRIGWTSAETTVLDGYTWKVEAVEQAAVADVERDAAADAVQGRFAAIAARQLINQQSRTRDMSAVAALDRVHAIAQRTGIVTPYSSMLVLVDERQREALRQAEASADRFNRTVENGTDELTDPDNPLSIPEPSQVLGLIVGAIALIVLKRNSSALTSPPIKRGHQGR
ncbi:MAG: TIGR02921 family PEP-CTERM protein [Phormidesmis sp. RL_2_1]|nr:TIGR02921 family PEP-CTERM protein [Phormidesmis sp. RL_2_1]